jgi:hypothetical protein
LALATFIPSRVRILIRSDSNFGDHGQHVEQQPTDRVVRVVDGPTDVEHHAGGGEFFHDVAGVGKGAGQPVEFGDNESVAGAARCQRFP